MPKLNRMSVLMRRGAAATVMNRITTLCLSPFPIVAAGALLMCCPAPSLAAEAPAVREPSSQPAQAQEPSGEPQGHQMRRYQAFARQAELPPITVTSETTLQVGKDLQADTSRLAQLSTREKETLAGQFGVPVGVVAKVAQRVSTKPTPGAAQLARELRTAVVDYQFLQGEWGRYHPPTEGQQIKADALEALQAGDIAQAWALYDGLSRPEAPVVAPSPPANLRVVAGQ